VKKVEENGCDGQVQGVWSSADHCEPRTFLGRLNGKAHGTLLFLASDDDQVCGLTSM
jgi:hypothetical protein